MCISLAGQFALEDILPANIDLIQARAARYVCCRCRVDDGLFLVADPKVILAAFGDMMRVPGRNKDDCVRGGDSIRLRSPFASSFLPLSCPLPSTYYMI